MPRQNLSGISTENLLEYQKIYYSIHKTRIRESANSVCQCVCGSTYKRNHKVHHEKTKKHIVFLSPDVEPIITSEEHQIIDNLFPNENENLNESSILIELRTEN
jgi:hypothetical protein